MRVKDWSKKNVEVGKDVHPRSLHKTFPPDARPRLIEEECGWWWRGPFPNRCASKIDRRRMWKLAKKSIEGRFTKISQQIRVKDQSKKNMEVGEEVHRRSLHKKFPTDARQRLIEEECGSWRRSPSKVVSQKFLNTCASKIDRRRMWKLAKQTIEGRSTKISQQMRVKDWSKKNMEVGEANHRRSLDKNF